MDITVTQQNDYLVIAPAGRLDSVNAPILDRKLTSAIESGKNRLVIDLSALEYISSIGLSTLLSAAKKVRRSDGSILLAGMNERVKTIMDISGFSNIFKMFPSVESAIDG